MVRESGVGPNGTEPPRGESEMIKGQHSTTLKTTKMRKHLVRRNAGGALWTWQKVTAVVDSGAAENLMPKSMFPEISTEETERSKNGQGVQRTRRRAHQELWTLGHVRQNPRTPCVGISHHSKRK